jgi:Holliday junction resolvase RusA-like endonuclease
MSNQPFLLPPPIPTELQEEWPDQDKLRGQLLSLYEQYSGQKLHSPTPTAMEMDAVVQWLNKNAETFLPHFHRRRVVLVPKFSPSLTAKISSLAQFHCPICATKDGLFPVHTIPIRITPASKQAISQVPKKRAAFERAIRHRFKDHETPFPPDKAICLLIVFVVKAKGAQKDLDNMAKAIVDAVKNVLFGDDRRIDHLNIIRIKSPDEEFVYLNIRQTKLNEHNDVLVPRMLHSWAGAEVLNLEDFIEP